MYITRGDFMNDVINLISSCGFPIFACIYLVKNQSKQIEKLSEIIKDNTKAIEKLVRLSELERSEHEHRS